MANEVRIHTAVSGNAAKEIGNVKDAWATFQKKGAEGLQIGAGMAVASKAFSVLDTAIGKSIDWLAEGVQGAKEEEAGIKRLGQSLRANVKDWDGNTDALERRVRAAAQMGFADDEIRDSLARLVAVTHDVNKAFELQQTAMDLARFKNISLADASQALIKVEGGQYRALKELGIVLEKGATQTEALAAVQKVAMGQASEYMTTAAGRSELLAQKVDDLGERVGGVLIPALDEATQGLLDFFDAIDPDAPLTLEDRLKTLSDTLNGLNPMLWGYTDAQKMMEDAQKRNAAATDGMIGPLGDAGRKLNELRSKTDKAGDAAGEARDRIKGLGGAAQKAADRFADLKQNVDDAAQAIAEAAYGPEELRLSFRKTQLELKDNEDALAEVEKKIRSLKDKGKPVPRELRERFLDLRASINDNKQSLIETGIRLSKVGGMKMDALQKEFEDAGIDLSNLSGDAKLLWYWLTKASNVKFSDIVSGGGRGGKASGGYTAPGDSAVVGERGMEGVKALPGGGFMTFPMDGRGAFGITPQAPVQPLAARAAEPAQAMGGSPIVIQLVADGRVLAEAVAPGVTAWQQRRGL